jgi:hypothetical protein
MHKLPWRITRAYTLQGILVLVCKTLGITRAYTPREFVSQIFYPSLTFVRSIVVQGVFSKRNTRAYTLLA